MTQRLLAALLHWANSDPPWNRLQFYELKDRLLRRYGMMRGHDIQEIRKECYGERRYDEDGDWHYTGCRGEGCSRCRGTGIFSIRWIRLEHWQWRGYVFHKPTGETTKPCLRVDIRGRIEHRNYGRLSNEAVLWLYLLTGEWRLFGQAMRSSSHCYCRFWPLLNLQRVTMWLSMKFRRQPCGNCMRRFWTWGSGWQWCKRCRSVPQEIPF